MPAAPALCPTRSTFALPLALTLAAASSACGKPAAPHDPSFAGPAKPYVSTVADRKELAVTVYNGGFGLVREVRDVHMPEGRVALEWQDIAARVQTQTVQLASQSRPDGITIFEQNYRYDLLSPRTLLDKHVGKMVKLHRWNDLLGREEDFDGKLLSVAGAPLFEVNGEVTAWYDRISFAELPKDLQARPTLVLNLGSRRADQRLELAYVTSGMGWSADYVLTLDDRAESADLAGWVTLHNDAGVSFENATLRLVAGDVRKLTEASEEVALDGLETVALRKRDVTKERPRFVEEKLFEYHLYTLSRKADVMEHEKKQISLLRADGIAVKKTLRFSARPDFYRTDALWQPRTSKVGVFLEIENKENNHLGIPLPKGVIRVYMNDPGGMRQIIGEDEIDHTPRDEKVTVRLGSSFDVVADRRRIDLHYIAACTTVSDWEIELRNHKSKPETVEVREPVGGEWTIVSSSHPAVKEDAETFLFRPTIPAGGTVKITYRVRVKWC